MERPRQKQSEKDPTELMCSVLTHEIANSLHLIYSLIAVTQQHLQQNSQVGSKVYHWLRLATEETNRLALLLDDFRSSRLFSLHFEPTTLASVIEDCLPLEATQDSQGWIRSEFDIPSDLPPIMADPAKLKQVFLNLYTNAVEAMPDGGVITVKAFERDGSVCVDLSDTGQGIPEGMQIFEPFVTNKPNGTGLGLAIVNWIVLAHGGTISYTSKPGEGTTFRLSFPTGSD